MIKKQIKIGFSSYILHIIAMATMLTDHMYHTLFIDKIWMNAVGRITFPIFAFMIVEGYHHTRNVKKYMLRLLIFAIISEMPFDLMIDASLFYPFYQNVMWTFFISLCAITLIEKVKSKYQDNRIILFFLIGLIVIFSYLSGMVMFVDYFGYGVLTVLTFYFLREKRPWKILMQIIILAYINIVLLGRYSIPLVYVGEFALPVQSLALFSLPVIWLYNGKRGYHSNFIKYIFYAFYPLHMLILALIMIYT